MQVYLNSEVSSCRHEVSCLMMPSGTQALSVFSLYPLYSVGFCAHACHITVLGGSGELTY